MIQWREELPTVSGSYNTWGPFHGQRKVFVWAKLGLAFLVGLENESSVGIPLNQSAEKLGIFLWLGPIAEKWDLWPDLT